MLRLRVCVQDLVEELSKEKTWYTPKKVSQQAYERSADGSFAGYEEEVCGICSRYFMVCQWSETRSCNVCHPGSQPCSASCAALQA